MSAAVLSGPPLGAWSRKSLPRWCRSRAAQEKRVGPSSIWSRKYRSCSLPWAAERENHLVAASRSCGMPLSACQQEESPRAQAARPLPWRTMPPPATRLSPRPCHPDRAPPVRTGRGSARPPRGHTIRRRSIGHIYDPAPLPCQPVRCGQSVLLRPKARGIHPSDPVLHIAVLRSALHGQKCMEGFCVPYPTGRMPASSGCTVYPAPWRAIPSSVK